MKYERDPQEIYRQSFAICRKEGRLENYPEKEAEVFTRIIHACGMPEIIEDLIYSDNFIAAGINALRTGKPVYCDSNMVATGIIRRNLPASNNVLTMIDMPEVAVKSRNSCTTRSAAAVDLWCPGINGAIAVIGNAPTALFRLLELIDLKIAAPALIIGFPVGFVGATESKAELAKDCWFCEYILLQGRRGGSAMAAAVLNSLAHIANQQ